MNVPRKDVQLLPVPALVGSSQQIRAYFQHVICAACEQEKHPKRENRDVRFFSDPDFLFFLTLLKNKENRGRVKEPDRCYITRPPPEVGEKVICLTLRITNN